MITAEYTVPGVHVRDHQVPVPLDWSTPDSAEGITLFARELVAPHQRNETLPCLLYLQGGPGGKGPRPLDTSGWLGPALKRYRVILMDQRGTGRSSRIEGGQMAGFGSPELAVQYLMHFRADSIVADAEHLRRTVFGDEPWSTLGQSYGGFLTLTYLSQAPEGLKSCFVTGGLASLHPDAREVYRRTFPRVEAKNRLFYERYPHHVETVANIADGLNESDVFLPDGDKLSVRRFQALGLDFGMQQGFERMNWLLDEAVAYSDHPGRFPASFLSQVMQRTSFGDNPLFAVMQESIYGHGVAPSTGWAAGQELDEHPQFDERQRPLLFTGEMIFPWMFNDIKALQPFAAAAEILAAKPEWSTLYDLDRLASNDVPVAAAIYFNDMYVDAPLSLRTAHEVGSMHAWVTSEFEHDGVSNARVFQHLSQLLSSTGKGVSLD